MKNAKVFGAAAALALVCGVAQPVAAQAQVVWSLSSLSSRAPRGYDWALEWDKAEVSRSKTYAKITGHRIANGRMPWLRDKSLDAQAQQWAEQLSAMNSVHYSGLDVRENIYFSPEDPNGAFDAWRTNPGDNGNMLDPRTTRVGIGVAHAFVDGQYGFIVVMQAR